MSSAKLLVIFTVVVMVLVRAVATLVMQQRSWMSAAASSVTCPSYLGKEMGFIRKLVYLCGNKNILL